MSLSAMGEARNHRINLTLYPLPRNLLDIGRLKENNRHVARFWTQ
jgi:hypothetical protein